MIYLVAVVRKRFAAAVVNGGSPMVLEPNIVFVAMLRALCAGVAASQLVRIVFPLRDEDDGTSVCLLRIFSVRIGSSQATKLRVSTLGVCWLAEQARSESISSCRSVDAVG